MSDTFANKLKITWTELLPQLRFRPHTGRIWLDLAFLLVVGAVHHTILPSLTGGYVMVDLMTPWLITGFVVQTLPRAALFATFGALILEMHSAAPAGLYICAYWVIAVVLALTRSALSWRHAFPWIVTFAASEVWIVGFESFVIGVTRGSASFNLSFGLAQVPRVVLSVGLGLLFCRRWLNPFAEEEPFL